MTKTVPGILDLKSFLPYRLSVVTNKVSSNLASMYSLKFDLSIAEWRVMAVLGQQSDLSADEVCRETEMDKVTVSRAVTKLLNKKLLQRSFSREDRRRSILCLSSRGYSTYSQIVPMALSYEESLLSALSEKEVRQLDELLLKLNGQARELAQSER